MQLTVNRRPSFSYNSNKSPEELNRAFEEFDQLLNSDFFQRTSKIVTVDAKQLRENFSSYAIRSLAEHLTCDSKQFFVRQRNSFDILDNQDHVSKFKAGFMNTINLVVQDYLNAFHKLKSHFEGNILGREYLICSNLHGSKPILSFQILRGDLCDNLILKYTTLSNETQLLSFYGKLDGLLEREFLNSNVKFFGANVFHNNSSRNLFLAENLYKFIANFQESEIGQQLLIKMHEADAIPFSLNLFKPNPTYDCECNLLLTKRGFVLEMLSEHERTHYPFEKSGKFIIVDRLAVAIQPDLFQLRFDSEFDYQTKLIEWLKVSASNLYRSEIQISRGRKIN